MPNNNERYTFSLFSTFPTLIQGFFPRSFGSVTHDWVPSHETLSRVAKNLSLSVDAIKLMNQVHGGDVTLITSASPQVSKDYDAMVTKEHGIFLGVKTADCIPVLFYDPVQRIIGACHAGYKGLLADVIPNTLTQMKSLGSRGEDILVGIGPCICDSCYNVQVERIELFKKKFPEMEDFYHHQDETYYLDLKKIAKYVLEKEGIVLEHIEIAPFCTKEKHDLFFSRRVEPEGVFLTGIGMI